MNKSIELLINKPIHQERRFQFIGKKQIEYWAEIDAGAYKYLPESERRIVYSELEVKALIAELEQAQQRNIHLDSRNAELNSTMERWAVERAENSQSIEELEKRLRETEETLIAATDHIAELEARPLCVKLPDELDGKSFEYIANKFQVPMSATQWVLVGWNACLSAGGTVEGE